MLSELSNLTILKWTCIAYYLSKNNCGSLDRVLIPRISSKNPWYSVVQLYLSKNLPVTIENVTNAWNISKWRKQTHSHDSPCCKTCPCKEIESFLDNIFTNSTPNDDLNHTEFYKTIIPEIHHNITTLIPDITAICHEYSKSEVSIVDCDRAEFNSQERCGDTVESYIHSWAEYKSQVAQYKRFHEKLNRSGAEKENCVCVRETKSSNCNESSQCVKSCECECESCECESSQCVESCGCECLSTESSEPAVRPTRPRPFHRYCRDWHCQLDDELADFYSPHPSLTEDILNQYSDLNNTLLDVVAFKRSQTPLNLDGLVMSRDCDDPSIESLQDHSTEITTDNDRDDSDSISNVTQITGSCSDIFACKSQVKFAEKDDYRFVYLGPHSSWTPLHNDVFGSLSWSTNVSGAKLWIFFPPDVFPLLSSPLSPTCDAYNLFDDQYLRTHDFHHIADLMQESLVFLEELVVQHYTANLTSGSEDSVSVDNIDMDNSVDNSVDNIGVNSSVDNNVNSSVNNSVDNIGVNSSVDSSVNNDHVSSVKPNTPSVNLNDALLSNDSFLLYRGPLVMVQMPGDAVLVPSGFSHQVVNLTDCMSVNHNWVNAWCLGRCDSQMKLDIDCITHRLQSEGEEDTNQIADIHLKNQILQDIDVLFSPPSNSLSCSSLKVAQTNVQTSSSSIPSLHKAAQTRLLALLERHGSISSLLHAHSGCDLLHWHYMCLSGLAIDTHRCVILALTLSWASQRLLPHLLSQISEVTQTTQTTQDSQATQAVQILENLVKYLTQLPPSLQYVLMSLCYMDHFTPDSFLHPAPPSLNTDNPLNTNSHLNIDKPLNIVHFYRSIFTITSSNPNTSDSIPLSSSSPATITANVDVLKLLENSPHILSPLHPAKSLFYYFNSKIDLFIQQVTQLTSHSHTHSQTIDDTTQPSTISSTTSSMHNSVGDSVERSINKSIPNSVSSISSSGSDLLHILDCLLHSVSTTCSTMDHLFSLPQYPWYFAVFSLIERLQRHSSAIYSLPHQKRLLDLLEVEDDDWWNSMVIETLANKIHTFLPLLDLHVADCSSVLEDLRNHLTTLLNNSNHNHSISYE